MPPSDDALEAALRERLREREDPFVQRGEITVISGRSSQPRRSEE